MNEYTQTRRQIVREIAKAEEYAPFGEKPKRKSDWEQREAELQEILK